VTCHVAVGTLVAMLVATSGASAQGLAQGSGSATGSWEIGGGVTWIGSFTGPSSTAELTANGESSGGFDLFTAKGEVGSGVGVGASLAFYVSPTIALEAGLRYSRPILSYRLADDVENAPPLSAEETLSRYVFTGTLVWHFRRLTSASRVVPFVAGGGGYIRDLHQRNELIETGGEFHAVGGLKYWLGTGRHRFGLRGQAGFSVTSGGFDFKDTSRTLPIVSASLLYLF
jgi:hypothetical protein